MDNKKQAEDIHNAQAASIRKKHAEALKLAKEVRTSLSNTKISVGSLLRKCHRISKLLGKEEQNKWITLELNGYSQKYPTIKDLEGHLPDYRRAPCQHLDERGNPILLGDDRISDLIGMYPIVASIFQLEKFATKGMYVFQNELHSLLRDKFGIPYMQTYIPNHNIVRILEFARTRVQDLADSVYDELGDTETKNAVPDSSDTDGVIDVQGSKKVFVAHGRNLKARDAMFSFLRSIGLNPVEWSQAVQAKGKPTPYVGQILDAAFSVDSTVVVVMTPDDEARLQEQFWKEDDQKHETELTGQPRQNVLFEAGMAMGRNSDRTVLVQLGNLRPFSDVLGRHILKLDNSAEKRMDLVQRLQLAGCPVDISGRDWLRTGDFGKALEDQRPKPLEQKALGEKSARVLDWVTEFFTRMTLKQMARHQRFMFLLKYEPTDPKKVTLSIKVPKSVRKTAWGREFEVLDFKVTTRGHNHFVTSNLAKLARKFRREGAKASDKFTFEITYPT
jgi:predicted nucleotide-binding protein